MAVRSGGAAARLLVTGFGPFPGAPVNPTARLAEVLRARPPEWALAGEGAFRAEVLDVDYAAIGPRLSRIGAEFAPDIAIHFGLAAECRGFRLERVARNSHAGARPDINGALPAATAICAGPATLASRLPLGAIAAALEAAGLPVEWSDDAGGYLCNMTMTLSLARACEGFAPAVSGFVHVPLTREAGGTALAEADLLAGARIIIDSCLAHWPA
ncbi:MAG: peptidase C15 [Alphaproteobacteria bacterium]|nr:MAG: peptidase C15 [Alphaproteobacteria bacterium]